MGSIRRIHDGDDVADAKMMFQHRVRAQGGKDGRRIGKARRLDNEAAEGFHLTAAHPAEKRQNCVLEIGSDGAADAAAF